MTFPACECYTVVMEINKNARAIFNSMREGILIIDKQGVIVFANDTYTRFANKERGEENLDTRIEGIRLPDLRPNSRLLSVVQTGQVMMHTPRKEEKDVYFVNMYPVFIDGKPEAGLSVVTFVDDASAFRTELENYENRARQVIRRINKASGARHTFDSIIAADPVSLETKAFALKMARADATVLLQSESGTGKELYAQAIHNASPRSNNVFVAVNCANFSAEMLESELFGYEEGSFTGAKKGGKMGLIEAANHGTVFLDEISEMPLELQAKLLRVLEERRFRKMGAVGETAIDVRVIAACNADLPRYIQEGKFRQDLYYRLNVFPVRIPPLRSRVKDIPALAESILRELSHRLKRDLRITDEALAALEGHSWPGNVRELRNMLEFSANFADDGVISLEILPGHLVPRKQEEECPVAENLTLAKRVKAFEKAEIARLLQKYGSDTRGKQKTAELLGISLATLYNKLDKEISSI